MKILLALLLTVAAASAQLIGDTTIYRGDYFGIMIPSAKCSNERLGVDINVYADGELEGLIRNWDNYEIATFDSSWPFFNKGKFNTSVTGIGDFVKGTISKTGSLKGTARINGCTYTFTAYRRYKVPQ